MFKVALYYTYTSINNAEKFAESQKALCKKLNLLGRIIISHEGINGTCAGSEKEVDAYISLTEKEVGSVDAKYSTSDRQPFTKLSIKVKDEIVMLKSPRSLGEKGAYLSPEQFHEKMLAAHPQMVVIDVRNNYESAVGSFEGAVHANISHFREFPSYIDKQISSLKDKEVLLYCTGGIRCEKASAYMKACGVEQVYQLKGGICRYLEKYPHGYFTGKNYVFDGRVCVGNGSEVASCSLCLKPSSNYHNCANASCNAHVIMCSSCLEEGKECCSAQCAHLLAQNMVQKRPPLHKAKELL